MSTETKDVKKENPAIVKFTDVRIAFANLFEPKAYKAGDAPTYKATFLIPKGSEHHKKISQAILYVAEAKWPGKSREIIDGIKDNPNKFCFQNGDKKNYEGYQGMMALTAKRKGRPHVVDRDNTPLTPHDGRPYSGCYVKGSVEFFTYNNSGNGISATLRGVQFYRDGDAFAGGAPVDGSEFESVEDFGESEAAPNAVNDLL